jgi:putative ABC transport system permease protein
MLRNYFLVAFRNIRKQKFYSFINILGLTIGVAATFFIILYVTDELSYEKFHTNIDRMYRVGLNGRLAGQEVHVAATPPPLAQAMVNEIPGVEGAIRMWQWEDVVIRYEDQVYTEDLIFHTDSNFFEFFTFKMIAGDPKTALKEPNSIVLTESMATKFFGNGEKLGRILTFSNDNKAMKVTGVVEDPPHNTHFDFNYLVSFSSHDFGKSDQWLSNSLLTCFIANENTDINGIVKKLNEELIPKYVGPQIQQFLGISLEQFLEQDGAYGYFVDPVKDLHLYSHVQFDLGTPGDIQYIYIFSAIGLFIILIASINFMNLSTARSSGRSREVGMRKTFGSLKRQLILQFLTESVLYSFFAVILAAVLVMVLIPQFNALSGKELSFHSLLNPELVGGVLLMVLMVGILSGSYPAFYLTSFRITEVLKGKVSKGSGGKNIRGGLVILQFAISILLIICTILVYNQLQYTQKKNLGFRKEGVIIISNADRLNANRQAFKDALIQESDVVAASYSNSMIPGVNNTTIFRKPGLEEDHIIGVYFGDHEHFDVLGYELAEGRNFSKDFPSDSSAILVNQAVADEMNWEEPIGEKLISFNGPQPEELLVVGMLKNFHFESLRENVRPLMIRLGDFGNVLSVRYRTDDPQEAVKLVEGKWKEFASGESFEYAFLDDNYDDLYRAENRLGMLFSIFPVLAIVIACLGLFGLAAFTAEQRTREIGIRKSMGASGFVIARLMSMEFVKYILIAFLIAIYPAYYFINNWLQNFAYRIDIDLWVFLFGGIAAFVIALITVSFQAIKAARINPATTLRYE